MRFYFRTTNNPGGTVAECSPRIWEVVGSNPVPEHMIAVIDLVRHSTIVFRGMNALFQDNVAEESRYNHIGGKACKICSIGHQSNFILDTTRSYHDLCCISCLLYPKQSSTSSFAKYL